MAYKRVQYKGRFSKTQQNSHLNKTYYYLLAGLAVSILVALAFYDWINMSYQEINTASEYGVATEEQATKYAYFIFLIIGCALAQLLLVIFSWFTKDEGTLTILFISYSALQGVFLGLIMSVYLNLPNGLEIVISAMIYTFIIFVILLVISQYVTLSRKQINNGLLIILILLLVLLLFGMASIIVGLDSLLLPYSIIGAIIMSVLIFFYIQANKHIKQPSVLLAWGLFAAIYELFFRLLYILSAIKR